MSESIERLQRRIEVAEELTSVTRTMKGLAAVSVRQFEQAASLIDDYERVVELGLQIALRDPDRLRRLDPAMTACSEAAIIVFGSNQGLCGPVNRHVAQFAREHADTLREELTEVVAVGSRLEVELELAGLDVTERIELPGTIDGISSRATQLLLLVDAWRAARPGIRVVLSFPRSGGRSSAYEPVARQLLPYDVAWLRRVAERPWPTHVLPTFSMEWPRLFSALMRQVLLLQLRRGFTEAMAAIAASRLAAMQAAERDVAERLAELQLRHHQLRQAKITEELLDVVSGFEVLSS